MKRLAILTLIFSLIGLSTPSVGQTAVTTPSIVSQLELPKVLSRGDAVRGIDVVGKHAFLAVSSVGLLIVDISDTENPKLVGRNDTRGDAQSVVVKGNYAYVADRANGLVIIDISDPNNPVPVGKYPDKQIRDVDVEGRYAYIAGSRYFPFANAALTIVDVSNPRNPKKVGKFSSGRNQGRSVEVRGKFAYLHAVGSGTLIVDVSKPSKPKLAAKFPTVNGSTFNGSIALSGDTAYMAANSFGVHVYDVSDPKNPIYLGGTESLGNNLAKEVVVSDTLVLVSGGTKGFKVLDVSTPNSPTLVGQLKFKGRERTFGIEASGDIALVGTLNKLYLVDISGF